MEQLHEDNRSNNNNDYDYDTDDENDDNDKNDIYNEIKLPITVANSQENNNIKQDSIVFISTEGISSLHIYQVENKVMDTIDMCIFCNKYYTEDMLISRDDTDNRHCYHCLFWMNYTIKNRKHVDGVFGMTIVDYIQKCKDFHEINTCTKNTDSGGCFLCEYNLGIPITDVIDLDKLYSTNNDNILHYSEDNINLSIYQDDVITIDI